MVNVLSRICYHNLTLHQFLWQMEVPFEAKPIGMTIKMRIVKDFHYPSCIRYLKAEHALVGGPSFKVKAA